jgi:hypothetical protein
MTYSTLLHTRYSGVGSGNYSGTDINQFGINVSPMDPNVEYVQTNGNQLIMHGHSPNPDPWSFFYTNTNDSHIDITMNIEDSQVYDGTHFIECCVRGQDPSGGAAIVFGAGGYGVLLNSDADTVSWWKMYPYLYHPTLKSISYSFSWPAKVRLVMDGKILNVYINDVFIDNYDYTSEDNINGYSYDSGCVGFRQYGDWDMKFNGILYKGDRLDNISIG